MTALRRLADLRSALRRQATSSLESAEVILERARSVAAELRDFSMQQASSGEISAAVMQLVEEVLATADLAANAAASQREVRASELHQRVMEERQIEKLIERADELARLEEHRGEQRKLDDWTCARRGVR